MLTVNRMQYVKTRDGFVLAQSGVEAIEEDNLVYA